MNDVQLYGDGVSAAKPARRGPKPSLTREVVVDAALDLIDDDGITALNLRKLATRLGVSAMTPYGYFTDKADLLAAAVDRGLEPLDAVLNETDPWQTQVRAFFVAMHETLEAHPGLLELAMFTNGTARLDEGREALIALLVRGGLNAQQAGDDLRALTAYVLGYGALTRLRRTDSSSRHTGDPFEHGLRLLLDSIEREAGRA